MLIGAEAGLSLGFGHGGGKSRGHTLLQRGGKLGGGLCRRLAGTLAGAVDQRGGDHTQKGQGQKNFGKSFSHARLIFLSEFAGKRKAGGAAAPPAGETGIIRVDLRSARPPGRSRPGGRWCRFPRRSSSAGPERPADRRCQRNSCLRQRNRSRRWRPLPRR